MFQKRKQVTLVFLQMLLLTTLHECGSVLMTAYFMKACVSYITKTLPTPNQRYNV